MMTATATDHKCDATNTKVGWDEWGTRGIPCHAVRGLRSFVDREGTTRYACPAPGHFANVERRFGHLAIAEPCAMCHRLAPILEGTYQRFATATAGIFLLCDDCASKADDSDEDDEPEYDLNPEGDPTRNGAFG